MLSDLDPEEIPAGLTRVAAQTGRRLVPPLERRLLEELDGNDWFRERVGEAFDGTADAEDPLEGAAALFLFRPQGWDVRLDEITRRSEKSERSNQLKAMARRIEKLELELEVCQNRAKRRRREADQAARDSDRRAEKAVAAERARWLGRIEDLSQENQRMRRDLSAMSKVTEDLDNALRRLAETRDALEKERRRQPSRHPEPTPSAWADLDVLGAARLLDDVARALLPESSFTVAPVLAPEEPTLCLPNGMAPDHRSAIKWLLTVDRSFVLLVDGYNLGYHLDHVRFNSPEIRRRLENDLVRLKALARGRPQVTVVYDSTQTGGTTSDSVAGGIEVRFTSAGHTADDELVHLAGVLGESAVVVSSDRMVRERAQEAGSLGLWSEALAGWMLDGSR